MMYAKNQGLKSIFSGDCATLQVEGKELEFNGR